MFLADLTATLTARFFYLLHGKVADLVSYDLVLLLERLQVDVADDALEDFPRLHLVFFREVSELGSHENVRQQIRVANHVANYLAKLCAGHGNVVNVEVICITRYSIISTILVLSEYRLSLTYENMLYAIYLDSGFHRRTWCLVCHWQAIVVQLMVLDVPSVRIARQKPTERLVDARLAGTVPSRDGYRLAVRESHVPRLPLPIRKKDSLDSNFLHTVVFNASYIGSIPLSCH